MTVPARWINFIKRVMGLGAGRWVILLDLRGDVPTYEVIEQGKTEH